VVKFVLSNRSCPFFTGLSPISFLFKWTKSKRVLPILLSFSLPLPPSLSHGWRAVLKLALWIPTVLFVPYYSDWHCNTLVFGNSMHFHIVKLIYLFICDRHYNLGYWNYMFDSYTVRREHVWAISTWSDTWKMILMLEPNVISLSHIKSFSFSRYVSTYFRLPAM